MAIGVIAILAVLAAVFLFGPRVSFDTTISFDPASIGDNPQAWLAAREAEIPGIRDGLAKEIVWADPQTRRRTPLAIVYIHGFSASKGEIRPVPDMVARELGANLFFTRLAGHGRDGEAMSEATVRDWANDYAEAMAIGRAIGERVIVMATSTGAALATWGATRPELSRDVTGFVLVSPNYGVQAAGAWILTLPWGGVVAEMATGETRGFAPLNALHERFWTTRYPTRATLPMAALVEIARDSAVERIDVPALFVFSDADQVVRPELTREIAARWGAPAELMIVEESGDPGNHVIAGDALSPSTTDMVAGRISEWISSLPR